MLFLAPVVVPLALLVPAVPREEPGELMRRVVDALREHYYDVEFRVGVLPDLAAPWLERARAADDPRAERELVHEFLGHVPASHLGLLSQASHDALFAELERSPRAMFGMQLTHLPQGWFADWVYEGGPADRAGIARGDQVLSIDGLDPGASPRLDWRTDDAALDDPALHALLAAEGDVVELRLRRRTGLVGTVRLRAAVYSGWEATLASVREIEVGDLRFGYVHYWFIPMTGGTRLLRELCTERFAGCDALVFDLRGRGGAGHEALAIAQALDPRDGIWRKPLVALVHADSRSAKEVISWELKERGAGLLVGERTRGAVIPATFREVGSGMVLMFPSFTLGHYTADIEGKGVAPDVEVAYPLPWTAGADPVLAAGLRTAAAWCDELAGAASAVR